MKVLLLIDIAAFKQDRQLVLDRCLGTATRLLNCALLLEDPSTIRWGYRIINSQYEPESFGPAYKNVAGYGDDEDAAGSALQKGGTDLLEISSGSISEFSRVLKKLTLPDVLSSLTNIKSDGSFSGTTLGRYLCLQKYFTLLQTYFTDGKGSNLHDGDNGAPDIGSGIVVLFSAAPQAPQDVLHFLELDGASIDMATADTRDMFWAATRPDMSKIFSSMDLQPCWVDTEASTAAGPQGEAAEYWRAGVRDRQVQDGRFRYGIIQAHVDGSYEIRYDDGKGHDHVDPARCEVDWVQPDATQLAAAARKAFGQTGGTYRDGPCSQQIHHDFNLLMRRLGPAASGERALFSLHELASHMDGPLVSAQYVPLFSLLGAPALPTIQTKLAGLPTAEGVVTGGLDAAQHLAASLQPHNSAVASLKGTIKDRAKEIKKGRKMEVKAAKKAAKRIQGQAGVKGTQPNAPEQVEMNGHHQMEENEASQCHTDSPSAMCTDAGDIVHQHLLACGSAGKTLEEAVRYRDEHLASCSYTELTVADVQKTGKWAGALVRDAVEGLKRFEAAEIQEAGRCTEVEPLQLMSSPGKWAERAALTRAAALGALGASLLLGWEDIHAKHPNHRKETAGQKNARRDEQLLQLLLRMHILARLAVNPDVGLTKRQKVGVVELFDQLGISLIGESVSAADVYSAVLQPCFGAALPSLMEPLAESCGQAEASLPSIPSPGTQVTGSFARHSTHSECCDSISLVNTSTMNARESSHGNRPREHAPSSSFLSGSHSACQTAQGSRDVRHSRPVASNLLGKQKNGRTAVDRMASRSRLAPVAKDPRALAKISIADMQHKRRHRSHRTSKRPGSGAVRGKPVLPPSQPNSTTPEAQRTNVDGSTMMTPQSRRKATPDEVDHEVELECIPETELKGASDMVSADIASRPLMRQPLFGAIPVRDQEQLASSPNREEQLPPAQNGARVLQDVERQPLAPTWLFPAQNKRANIQSKAQPQALKPPAQPPSHVGLLEQLALTVVAAEKSAPPSPAQQQKTAQQDVAVLPQTAPVAAEPQQSSEQMPSANLGDTTEGVDAVGGGGAMHGLELPAAEAPVAQEHSSREAPDEVPAGDSAAAEYGSVPFHLSGQETRVIPEPPNPPPDIGHEPAAAAERDPYDFDPDMDAASDGSERLEQHLKGLRSQPDQATGLKEGTERWPRAAAVSQEGVSVSQGYSGPMMPDAYAQIGNVIEQMSSEASPSACSGDGEAACLQGGTHMRRARFQQRRSQVAADLPGHVSGVALRSRHCAQPRTVVKRQQQPKKRRRKEDADLNAACGTPCLPSAEVAPDTVGEGRRTRSRAADEAKAARPATRSSKPPLLVPSPPPYRGAKRERPQPQCAASTPKRSAKQPQPQLSPEPAAGTEAKAAPPECSTAEIPQRPRRERRLSSKYGDDYVSSLHPCILNGATAAGDPWPAPQSLQGCMHHAQTPEAGALAERSLGADRNASAASVGASPVRSNSSVRHEAATEDTGPNWEDIVAADMPAGTSNARGAERPSGLETVQEDPEPEELPCSANPPALEEPAAAACSQPQVPDEHLLRRSSRVAQDTLGAAIPPEFDSLPSPRRPPACKAHTTPSTAQAGGAPMPAAAAELKTPAAFRAEQMKAATEEVMQRKRAAPCSTGRCAPKRRSSLSSWRTDQAEQSGGGEPATGEIPSGVLQERSSKRIRNQKKQEQVHQQPEKPGRHGTGQGRSANAQEVPESAAPYQMRKVRTPSCKLQQWY